MSTGSKIPETVGTATKVGGARHKVNHREREREQILYI